MAEFPFFTEKLMNVAFRHITNSSISRSISGTRQSFAYGGGYWELRASLANCDYYEAKQIAAFINSQDGRASTFTIYLPPQIAGNNNYGGDIFVKGASQTGKNILVDGMTPARTILKKGDFIKFANSAKVYQVSEDLISDNLGEGTLSLHTHVVGDLPSDNENIIYKSNLVSWTVALKENYYDWDLNYYARSGWEIELEEVWG